MTEIRDVDVAIATEMTDYAAWARSAVQQIATYYRECGRTPDIGSVSREHYLRLAAEQDQLSSLWTAQLDGLTCLLPTNQPFGVKSPPTT